MSARVLRISVIVLAAAVVVQAVLLVRQARELRRLAGGIESLARIVTGLRSDAGAGGAPPMGIVEELAVDWPEPSGSLEMLGRLHAELARAFCEALDDWDHAGWRASGHGVAPLPAMDARMDGANFVISMGLPGMRRDEISVTLRGNVLTVESCDAGGPARPAGREQGAKALLGRVQLPGDVTDEESIRASYEGGVLRIVVPQRDRAECPTSALRAM